jgi:hypothetical protein
MTTPQLRKKKLQVRIGFEHEANCTRAPTPHTPGFSRPGTPSVSSMAKPKAPVEPSVFDLSFEEYKAANLNIDEQHALIGKIRDEVPLADRDEIDMFLLKEAAKQLELCVFPMCKMMHVDPMAVKKMLDDQFRKAYGLVEETPYGMQKPTIAHEETMETIGVKDDDFVTRASTREPSVFSNIGSQVEDGAVPTDERAKKKVKRTEQSAVQKEVKAYQAKKKRGRKRCYILTLTWKIAAEQWAALTTGP